MEKIGARNTKNVLLIKDKSLGNMPPCNVYLGSYALYNIIFRADQRNFNNLYLESNGITFWSASLTEEEKQFAVNGLPTNSLQVFLILFLHVFKKPAAKMWITIK